MNKIGVGLYGTNGHQIHGLLKEHPAAYWAASAFMPNVPAGVAKYDTLDAMIADPSVQLVSLCSPKRSEQAEQAILCMRAGKHVYAEKPCALNEDDLDRILMVSRETGREFREMAGTAFEEPYLSITDTVRSCVLGEVVQVFVQKSYPYHDNRPQDEDIDGGILLQAGVHAFRLIEHAAGVRIAGVKAIETKLGNPCRNGELRMAASAALALENGGTASVVVNYLNQKGLGQWGNDHLRIFGTKGFVESTDGGLRTRLVVGVEDRGSVSIRTSVPSYFDMLSELILKHKPMPVTPEAELHPLRMAIRAKASL
jgi:predicted dehydrogenase